MTLPLLRLGAKAQDGSPCEACAVDDHQTRIRHVHKGHEPAARPAEAVLHRLPRTQDLGAQALLRRLDPFDAPAEPDRSAGGLECVLIRAYGGSADPNVTCAHLEAWARQTTASFGLQMFPGGRFYLDTDRGAFLASLARDLAPMLR